jgi:hypothetical protein
LLVGVMVAAALVAVELLFGVPYGLEARLALPKFVNVLALNAAAVLTPFTYIAVRTSDKADSVLDVGTTGFLSLMPIVSLIAWGGLWIGLGFGGFIVVHILMVAIIALSWIGWTLVRGRTRNRAQRRADAVARRMSR